MFERTVGYKLISVCIGAAAELGIPDLLRNGQRSVEEIARQTDVDHRSLYRIMRALAWNGIFVEVKKGTFKMNSLARHLCTDNAFSVRGVARFFSGGWTDEIWSNFILSIRNGKTIFENLHGMRQFQWYERNPEYSKIFDQSMTDLSNITNASIANSYNFSSINTLVDIAGGHGSLLANILKRHPGVKGILFDQPHVIKNSRREILGNDMFKGRCQFISGNFFEEIPAGGDVYMMKWIIHDWDDKEAIRILKNCRKAMKKGNKILLVEVIIVPFERPNLFSFSKLSDILMMASTGGCERTRDEYNELFDVSGFKLKRIKNTASPFSIIEGAAI